jgi:4-alpha-glucanotransferase
MIEEGEFMNRRTNGILLSITSLPSPYGIGDFGPESSHFVDFLARARQGFWQILPLNQIDPDSDISPYHSLSAFALNTLFISPELLVRDGLVSRKELESQPLSRDVEADYVSALATRRRLFPAALESFKKSKEKSRYDRFCEENAFWLEDFALFASFRGQFQGESWSDWPAEYRDRRPEALAAFRRESAEEIEKEKFLQYTAHSQWMSLKEYAHTKKVYFIGDLPIYVDYDSADVWSHPELFKLDEDKKPMVVAGVPPDYFSVTGQLWGNPIYDWNVHKESRYDWWSRRLAKALSLYDVVRIDHFRGLVGYWEVPSSEPTAVNGRWVEAPAVDFFSELQRRFLTLPIIAEDLGLITPDVREVLRQFGFPGMKVLLFAFGEDNPGNPYLPHNYEKNCVAYTGTHDNNTARGWFEREAGEEQRRRVFRYLGREVPLEEIHWALIRLIMASAADTVIIPLQDALGLGEEARMNRPATDEGNWLWRLLPGQADEALAQKLADITEVYGRS